MTSKSAKQGLKRTATVSAVGFVLAATLSACSPKVAVRGNLPLPSQLEQVKVGQTSKREVQQLIGSPSTVGTFDSQTWYYMSQKTEQWAFLDPEVIDHKVLVLYFDRDDTLQNLQAYTKEDLREIALQERETPTAGHDLSIIEQMLGNIGKFSPNPE